MRSSIAKGGHRRGSVLNGPEADPHIHDHLVMMVSGHKVPPLTPPGKTPDSESPGEANADSAAFDMAGGVNAADGAAGAVAE